MSSPYQSSYSPNPQKPNTLLDQSDEDAITDWINNDSLNNFKNEGYIENYQGKQIIKVIKYIKLRYLKEFLNDKNNKGKLVISTSPGYTWGDAIYVAPLNCPYTGAMFGRAGIVGYIVYDDPHNYNIQPLRIFDATKDKGIELYHKWIITQTELYEFLTTKVHSHLANRYLRNIFRHTYNIDILYFHPDEYNKAYVDANKDHWLAISDWQNLNPSEFPTTDSIYSDKVENCRWVVRVEESFDRKESNFEYKNYIGQFVTPKVPKLSQNKAAKFIDKVWKNYELQSDPYTGWTGGQVEENLVRLLSYKG